MKHLVKSMNVGTLLSCGNVQPLKHMFEKYGRHHTNDVQTGIAVENPMGKTMGVGTPMKQFQSNIQ